MQSLNRHFKPQQLDHNTNCSDSFTPLIITLSTSTRILLIPGLIEQGGTISGVAIAFHTLLAECWALDGAMGTGLRLFIAGGRLGRGQFYEASEECLRSPFDKIFCRELRLEVGRLAWADVGHLQRWRHEPISSRDWWAGPAGRGRKW